MSIASSAASVVTVSTARSGVSPPSPSPSLLPPSVSLSPPLSPSSLPAPIAASKPVSPRRAAASTVTTASSAGRVPRTPRRVSTFESSTTQATASLSAKR